MIFVPVRRVRKNHCCRGKAVSITYWSVYACVHAALLIQHAMRTRHCDVIRGPSVSITFFGIISQRRDFRKNGTEHKACALIFSTTFV